MQTELKKPRRGRPPKIARENSDTKATLIRSGTEQLTEFGFASSGIDQILKRVGVPKGSFYYYFASKEAFGLAVLDSYAIYFFKKLDNHLLDINHAPLQRIANFVADAEEGMRRHKFKRGCLIGNLEQEVDLLPNSFREHLINTLNAWQTRMAKCLIAAKEQGQISRHADVDALAQYFWIGWEGAVSRAKLVQNEQPLRCYLEHFINGLPR